MQLFGELDYVREANNCQRFRELYGGWKNVKVPDVCTALTRKKVLVMEWVDGQKGPWPDDDGIKMVRIGLRCSVDQLMTTGLFVSSPVLIYCCFMGRMCMFSSLTEVFSSLSRPNPFSMPIHIEGIYFRHLMES